MEELPEEKPRKKKCGCSWPTFTFVWETLTAFTDGQFWIPLVKAFARDPSPPTTGAVVAATLAGAIPGACGAFTHYGFNEDQNEDTSTDTHAVVLLDNHRRHVKCPERGFRYSMFGGDSFAHFQTFISSSVILIFGAWGPQIPIWGLALITLALSAFSGAATVGEVRPCLSAVRNRIQGIPEENNAGEKLDFFTWSSTIFGAYRSGVNGYALSKVLDVIFKIFFDVAKGPLGVSNVSAGIGFTLGFWALFCQLIIHTLVNLDFQDPTHHHDGVNWVDVFDSLNRPGKIVASSMLLGDYFPGHTNDYGQAIISIDSTWGHSLPLWSKTFIYPGVLIGSALAAKSESTVCRNKLVKKLAQIRFFAVPPSPARQKEIIVKELFNSSLASNTSVEQRSLILK